ncbi:MAG: alpha/beta hydrolase [Candidatus Marinimicrobia bacterium]|nr:alpha/beta hydrolase [Candidatus Neomarinimicrobiota bacterium]
MRIQLHRIFILSVLFHFGFAQVITATIFSDDLHVGERVMASGESLIKQDYGFIKIESSKTPASDTCIIAIHGYQSRGYEWIDPTKSLAEKYGVVYFYRYNWDGCIDTTSKIFHDKLNELLSSLKPIKKLVLFSHSYGGVILTNTLKYFSYNFPVEAHAIASPLAGYPSLTDRCGDEDLLNDYSPSSWSTSINHFQWRTSHKIDGAFKKLEVDPQDFPLANHTIIALPDSMDGHRLGHNWSITWVMREYLKSN